jgi:CheY-like chemotaxis protein
MDSPSPDALRVLIVDDNRDMTDSLAFLLRAWGHKPCSAYDGKEGLRLALEFQPEVMLLDIALPGTSGLDIARTVRARPEFKDTLLVAITGLARPEEQESCRQAGIDRHLAKPFDLGELERMLQLKKDEIASQSPSRSGASAAEQSVV